MTRRLERLALLVCVVAAVSAVSGLARAHDKSAHQGPTGSGELREVSGNTLLLSANGSPVAVELSPETKIFRDGTPASRSELRVGDSVEYEGPEFPGGGVAAREVWAHSGKEGQ